MTSRYSDVSSSRFQIKVTVLRYQTMNMIINYHYCLEMRNDFMMASLISRPQTHFPPPPTLSTTIFSALHSPSLLPFPLCFPYLLFIALLSSPLLISSLPVLPSLLFSFLFFSSLLFSSLVWYSSSTLVFRYHFFSVLPLSHHFPSFTPLHLFSSLLFSSLL